MGVEIYSLRSAQLSSLNKELNNLRYDHQFQFKVELKIKDNFFDQNIDYEKYLTKLQNSRMYDKQYGGTKIGPHRSDIISN